MNKKTIYWIVGIIVVWIGWGMILGRLWGGTWQFPNLLNAFSSTKRPKEI